jgi:hypothetical protein
VPGRASSMRGDLEASLEFNLERFLGPDAAVFGAEI